MKDFLIIAITPPEFREGEADRINQILSEGEADFVHIRKPGSSFEEVEKLISKIKREYYSRLKLHDHFLLTEKYSLGGVHFNSRNPFPSSSVGSVSKSIHSINEIENTEKYDYVFLSPVFDSISKKGYKASFDLNFLKPFIINKNIVALGGITPEKIDLLKETGFSGAAMLGYFFPI